MISLLSAWLIKNNTDPTDPAVRRAYGTLCGVVGIVLNLILFAGKYFAGVISGSIAITADAFNNLSDAGSSVVTLVGFKLSGKKPDPRHPFGHGRLEYLSGLIVSALILVMGVELGRTSIEKILSPSAVEFSWLSMGILAVSIAVKLYMSAYNRSVGRKIHSAAMAATATDSLSDTVATAAVLLASLVGKFTGWQIDGWVGALVALFILYAGFNAARETLSPLLGQAPDKELVETIERTVMGYPPILGMHDLVVHDYGPGRMMVSLHAEVPAEGDILALHDVVDNAEAALKKTLQCEAVIHMDPVVSGDAAVTALRSRVGELARTVNEKITIHDFRMVPGPTHTNLIFDAVVPFGEKMSNAEIAGKLRGLIEAMDGSYFAVITVENAYV